MFDPVDLPSAMWPHPPPAVCLCVKWFVPFLAPDRRIEPPLFAEEGGFSTEAESWLLERNRKPRGGERQTEKDRETEKEKEDNKERDLETKIERGTARIKGVLFTSGESSQQRLNLNTTKRLEFHWGALGKSAASGRLCVCVCVCLCVQYNDGRET